MSEDIDYKEIAQKLLDLEATAASEGWRDPSAIYLARQLNDEQGPFDLDVHHGQESRFYFDSGTEDDDE